jgi:hypothetical protein
MKYDDDENHTEVDALYFDGYAIAERQLEGLAIKVFDDHGTVGIEADWPKSCNRTIMIERAIDHVKYQDVFSLTEEMTDDDGFIDWDDKNVE